MNKITIICLFLLFLMSCEKYDNTCKCDSPLDDLPWLNEIKRSITNCACQTSIIQATYQKQTVFYTIMNDPVCNGSQVIYLLDCNGSSIKEYQSPLGESFAREVTDRKTLAACTTGTEIK